MIERYLNNPSLKAEKYKTVKNGYLKVFFWLEQLQTHSNNQWRFLQNIDLNECIESNRNYVETQIKQIEKNIIDNEVLNALDQIMAKIQEILQELMKITDLKELVKWNEKGTLCQESFEQKMKEFENHYEHWKQELSPQQRKVYYHTKDLDYKKRMKLEEVKQKIDNQLSFAHKPWHEILDAIEKEKKRIVTQTLDTKITSLVAYIKELIQLKFKTWKEYTQSEKFLEISYWNQEIEEMQQSFQTESLTSDLSYEKTKISKLKDLLTTYHNYIRTMFNFENDIIFLEENNKVLDMLWKDVQENYQVQDVEQYKGSLEKLEEQLQWMEQMLAPETTNGEFFEKKEKLTIELNDKLKQTLYTSFSVVPPRVCTEEYEIYQNMLTKIKKWKDMYSIEKLNQQKAEKILKNKIDTAFQTFKKIKQKNAEEEMLIDWQEFATNKKQLQEMLDQIYQMISSISYEKDSPYLNDYQELKFKLASLPTEEKRKETKKLKTLELLKQYQKQKKKIDESSQVSETELEAYLKSIMDYQLSIFDIQVFSSPLNNRKEELLQAKIMIINIILVEIDSLKGKTSSPDKIKTYYQQELYKLQKELFLHQHNGELPSTQDLLWKKYEIEQELACNPLNQDMLLEYLEVMGQLTEESYQQVDQKGELSKEINQIKAKKSSLITQKEFLKQYIQGKEELSTFGNQRLRSIDEKLQDYEMQLSILGL